MSKLTEFYLIPSKFFIDLFLEPHIFPHILTKIPLPICLLFI